MSSSFVKDCTDFSGASSGNSNKTVIIIVNNETNNNPLYENDLQQILASHGAANSSQISVVQMGGGTNTIPVATTSTNIPLLGEGISLPINFDLDGLPTIPWDGTNIDGYTELPIDADSYKRLESVLKSEEAKQILGEPLLDIVNNSNQLVDILDAPNSDNLAESLKKLQTDSSVKNSAGLPKKERKRRPIPKRRSQRQVDKAEREEVEKILAENQKMLREEREMLRKIAEEETEAEATEANIEEDEINPRNEELSWSNSLIENLFPFEEIPIICEKESLDVGMQEPILTPTKSKRKLARPNKIVSKDNTDNKSVTPLVIPQAINFKQLSIKVKKLDTAKLQDSTVSSNSMETESYLSPDTRVPPIVTPENICGNSPEMKGGNVLNDDENKDKLLLNSGNKPCDIISGESKSTKHKLIPTKNFSEEVFISKVQKSETCLSSKVSAVKKSSEIVNIKKRTITVTHPVALKSCTENFDKDPPEPVPSTSLAVNRKQKLMVQGGLKKERKKLSFENQLDLGNVVPVLSNKKLTDPVKSPVSPKDPLQVAPSISKNLIHFKIPRKNCDEFKPKPKNLIDSPKAKINSTNSNANFNNNFQTNRKTAPSKNIQSPSQLKRTLASASKSSPASTVKDSSVAAKKMNKNTKISQHQNKVSVTEPNYGQGNPNKPSPLLDKSSSISRTKINVSKTKLLSPDSRLGSKNNNNKEISKSSNEIDSHSIYLKNKKVTEKHEQNEIKSPVKVKETHGKMSTKSYTNKDGTIVMRSVRPIKKKKLWDDMLSLEDTKKFPETSSEDESEPETKKDQSSSSDIEVLSINSSTKQQSSSEDEDGSEIDDDPERLWCICQKPHDNRFMICCDRCEDWFHGACVGITKQMGKQMELDEKEWICPNCKEAEDVTKGIVSLPPKKTLKIKKVVENESQAKTIKKPGSKKSKDKPSEPRVLVYHKKTGVVLSGTEGPKLSEIGRWLYDNRQYNVISPELMKFIEIDEKTETRTIPLERLGLKKEKKKKMKSPSKSSVPPESPVKEKPKKHLTQVFKYKEKEKIQTPRVTKLISFIDNVGSMKKKKKEKSLDKALSQKEFYSSNRSTSIDTPKRNSIDTPRSKSTDTSKRNSIDTPKRKSIDKREDSTDSKKFIKEHKKVSKPPEIEKVKLKSETAKFRSSVQNKFEEVLIKRKSEASDEFKELSAETIKKISTEIEEELFELFNRDVGFKYKSRYRSIIFNVGDTKNSGLFRKILNSAIPPTSLVQMTSEQLANKELAEWRKGESLKEIEAIKKHELDKLKLGNRYIMKSHKGEIAIEKDEIRSKDTESVINFDSVPSEVEPEPAKEEEELDEVTLNHENHIYEPSCKICSKSDLHELSLTMEEIAEKEKLLKNTSLYGKLKRTDSSESSSKHYSSSRHRERHKSSRHKDKKRHHSTSSHEDDRSSSTRERKSSTSDHHKRHKKDRDRRHHHRDRSERKKRNRRSSSSERREHKKRDKSSERTRTKLPSTSEPEVSSTVDVESIDLGTPLPTPTPSSPLVLEHDTSSISIADPLSQLLPAEDPSVEEFSSYSPRDDSSPPMTPPLPTEMEEDEEPPFSPATPPLPDRMTPPPQIIQKQRAIQPPIWKGCISMVDVAKFSVAAFEVSGKAMFFQSDVPYTVEVIGRINPDTVWSYIDQQRKGGAKEILVVRFQPSSEEEKVSYIALYSYLSSKKRYGVIGNCEKSIKDFYIVPLASHQPIPQVLLPLDGPGFEESRPHMLIGVLVRTKHRKYYDPIREQWVYNGVPGKTHIRTSLDEDEEDIIPDDNEISYTPPPSFGRELDTKTNKQEVLKVTLISSPSEETTPPIKIDDSVTPEDLEQKKMLEELNRQIEKDKKELSEMHKKMDAKLEERNEEQESIEESSEKNSDRSISDSPTVDDSDNLPLDKISIPSNLQEILNSIKKKEDAIKEKEDEIKRRLNLSDEKQKLIEDPTTKDVDLRLLLPNNKPIIIDPLNLGGEDQDMRDFTQPPVPVTKAPPVEKERHKDPRMRGKIEEPKLEASSLRKMSDSDLLAKALEMESNQNRTVEVPPEASMHMPPMNGPPPQNNFLPPSMMGAPPVQQPPFDIHQMPAGHFPPHGLPPPQMGAPPPHTRGPPLPHMRGPPQPMGPGSRPPMNHNGPPQHYGTNAPWTNQPPTWENNSAQRPCDFEDHARKRRWQDEDPHARRGPPDENFSGQGRRGGRNDSQSWHREPSRHSPWKGGKFPRYN